MPADTTEGSQAPIEPARSPPRSFGVGVVGAGIMGRRMAAALHQHPRFRVAAVWDPDAEAARRLAADFGGAPCAASLQALAQQADVDAVYIASPPAFHLQGVRAAVAAGRACLCEKPLAHTLPEAQTLRDEVMDSGLPFAVHFPFARGAASRQLQALVSQGALGAVQRASLLVRFAQWPRPWQAAASDWLAGPAQGGFTREVLSHFVFLAQRLFGPAQVRGAVLERVQGAAETRLAAELVHADITLAIDAAVAGEVTDHNRFEVVGTAGRATLLDWQLLEYQGRTSERVDSLPLTLDAFAALLEGQGQQGLATVDEGLAVVQVVEALLAA